MKLQLALDTDLKTGLKLCKKVNKYIDIIELGTPLVKKHGLVALKKFKKFKKPIVADLKTMDTGFFEAEMAFKHGADFSTVCGCADLATIKGAIKAGKKYKKKIYVDFINVKDIIKRTKQILKFKPDYICIHTGIDQQLKGESPFKNLKNISNLKNKPKIAVAGGINLKTIDKIKQYKPEIIIVGGAITNAKNPRQAAKELKEALK
ncbi:MAG: 3-hexulose-6-phosphate synthase [archaeon]